MVPFAGFEMPVTVPHGHHGRAPRGARAAGLFDVSHMGEFEVRGERALDFVQHVTTNDAQRWSRRAGAVLHPAGRRRQAEDDLLVYRFPTTTCWWSTRPTRRRTSRWIATRCAASAWSWWTAPTTSRCSPCRARERRRSCSAPHRRGPQRHPVLPLRGGDGGRRPGDHQPHGLHRRGRVRAVPPRRQTAQVWRRLLEVGGDAGLLPAGLGCRDSLRLEMGYASTATTWTRTRRRWRRGSAGWSSWTRARSSARMRSARRRKPASSGGWWASG
jgi:aminomethyltransferase